MSHVCCDTTPITGHVPRENRPVADPEEAGGGSTLFAAASSASRLARTWRLRGMPCRGVRVSVNRMRHHWKGAHVWAAMCSSVSTSVLSCMQAVTNPVAVSTTCRVSAATDALAEGEGWRIE